MKLSEILLKNAPKPIVKVPTTVNENWYENIPQSNTSSLEMQVSALTKKVLELENKINKLDGEG